MIPTIPYVTATDRFERLANDLTKAGYEYIGEYIESSDGYTYWSMEWNGYKPYYIRCKYKVLTSGRVSYFVYCDEMNESMLDEVKKEVLEVIFNQY